MGPHVYSASTATSAITDEERQVIATTTASERLHEWREVEPKEAYEQVLWWDKTRERGNGTVPELRAWLNFQGPRSAKVKALLRTLSACARRHAHTGRVIDCFSQHHYLNEQEFSSTCASDCASLMKAHGLVKAEPARHWREPELNISDDYEELGRLLKAWAAKEYDRLQTLPGLEGEDELTHNLRAALVWDLVSTTVKELDDAVSNFLYCTEGIAEDPDLGAAAKHCRRAICLYYIIFVRSEYPPNHEEGKHYSFGNLCTINFERALMLISWPPSCDWFDGEARKAKFLAGAEAFGEWLERNHDAEPKLYKKHAHYDDLRWYVAGWFARTRVKEAVFRHLDAGRFIPDSKRFKAAGEEWSQLAAAAQ